MDNHEEAKRIVQAAVLDSISRNFLVYLNIYYEPDESIELMSIRQAPVGCNFHIHYNPKFVMSCSKEQLQKLIEHEFIHIIFSINR